MKYLNDTSNVLVLTHLFENNQVFEDYVEGIKENADHTVVLDYVEFLYLNSLKQLYVKIDDLIERNQITMIFFVMPSADLTFGIDYLYKLKKKHSLKYVFNFFDTEYFFEAVDKYYSQLADLVILPDYYSQYKFRLLGINVITTFALYSAEKIKKTLSVKDQNKYEYDVSFVGNIKQSNRQEIINALALKGIKVNTWGVGSINGFVDREDMFRVFNSSKINLNFTGTMNRDNFVVDLSSVDKRIRQVKGRPVEIAMAQGFILSEYAPGIEQLFIPGEEIAIFRNVEECVKKIEHYLSKEGEKERELMAERASVRALKEYDSRKGISKVFKQISLNTDVYNTCCTDEKFNKQQYSYIYYYYGAKLLDGSVREALVGALVSVFSRNFSFHYSYRFFIKGLVFRLFQNPQLYKKVKRIKDALGLRVRW
ncbi:glycosyltransferase [Hydrogenovibrio sp. JE_KL2]|uniref:glycosyltransferase family protein n=1 Tax=Hydrogenovibrio sp. JE_KL2 TaxID=2651188 RepID=UPI00128D94B2|nr:glycosyltransferase [Hydrogenovibrio sp. JE_KL2]MPQ75465.1 glycosyltransferase [Hydrogenovibrio sp. JE_KL2]